MDWEESLVLDHQKKIETMEKSIPPRTIDRTLVYKCNVNKFGTEGIKYCTDASFAFKRSH